MSMLRVTTLVLLCIIIILCITEAVAQRVNLNYDSTSCTDEAVYYGVQYDGGCSNFNVTRFTENDIEAGNEGTHLLQTTNRTIKVPTEDLNIDGTETSYIQILPVDEEGNACCDSVSHRTYYRFHRPGGNCQVVQCQEDMDRPDIILVNIPESVRCENHNNLLFIWPKYFQGDDSYCYCYLLSSEGYSFDTCVEECGSEYQLQLIDDVIIFDNPPNIPLAHFICETNPCTGDRCSILNSMMATLDDEMIVSYDTRPQASSALLFLLMMGYQLIG